MRFALALMIAVLPMRLKRVVGRLVFGWEIHPTAYLGRSIVIVPKLVLDEGASIGPFNLIRGVQELHLGKHAVIGDRNRIYGFPPGSEHFRHSPNRRSVLILRDHAMITTGHDIDCSDRVELHEYATVAGFGSQVLTHSLDLVRDRFVATPIEIGHHSAVMSGCILLNGTSVPPRSIVSAGSVVTTKLRAELTFYRGNPAEAVRELPPTLKYFRRGEAGVPAAIDQDDLRQ
ncbi:MAG: acyltransferase [Jatrophihabitans sp.]|uniref:acyltransferase n=1 Tax=Jatrophihabitans sp. TaxID=1932789 RepID=UPI003F807041